MCVEAKYLFIFSCPLSVALLNCILKLSVVKSSGKIVSTPPKIHAALHKVQAWSKSSSAESN